MESTSNDSGVKRKLENDSQQSDETLPKRSCIEQENLSTNLLDLSDDVLLCILKHCHPKDLKSLGFSCERLGNLVRDRTLWCSVDARGRPMGTRQVAWLVTRMLHEHTRDFSITGYANESMSCLGKFNSKRPVKKNSDDKPEEARKPECEPEPSTNYPSPRPVQFFIGRHNQHLPRYSAAPSWPDAASEDQRPGVAAQTSDDDNPAGSCPGPLFSVGDRVLRDLRTTCPALTRLALEYCNINYETAKIENFPPTLKNLSLRGTRCFNMGMNKSYLFQVQLQLPNLEELDLSECSWLEAATLLPLSKLPKLRTLLLAGCPRLGECVAYSSLAARYGFKTLEKLDLTGSPMGDSELSAFGWCVALTELRLAPATHKQAREEPHFHYEDDPRVEAPLQDDWEEQEPEYFAKLRSESPCQDAPTPPKTDATPSQPDQNQLNIEAYDHVIHVSLNRPRPGEQRPNVPNPNEPNVVHVSLRRQNQQNLHHHNLHHHHHVHIERNMDGNVRIRRHGYEPRPAQPPDDRRLNIQDLGVVEGGFVRFSMNRPPQVIPGRRGEAGPTSKQDKSCQSDPIVKGPIKKDVSTSTSDGAGPSTSKQEPSTSSVKEEGPSEAKKARVAENAAACDQGVVDLEVVIRNDRVMVANNNEEDVNVGNNNNEENVNINNEANVNINVNINNEANVNIGNNNNEGANRMEQDPRVHVLYVNARPPQMDGEQNGQREEGQNDGERPLNPLGLPRLPNDQDRGLFLHVMQLPFIENILYRPSSWSHLDDSSLISDTAIHRFGNSDDAQGNYVHIGPNGVVRMGANPGPSDRPHKSKLKILVLRGFTGITNRSLVHLTTAAPDLRYLDVRGTKVTKKGAENFRTLRPDCELITDFNE